MARLQHDLPTYIAAANGVSIDHGYEGDFTKRVLSWWKSNATEVGACSEVARIALAMAPNSAEAERIFSLLEILFGSKQGSSLSDYSRVSILLRYKISGKRPKNGRIKVYFKRRDEALIFIDHTAHFAQKNGRKWHLIREETKRKMALLKRKAR
jgi:hypothetical protein